MTERYRITSVQASKTLTTGKPTVSLYGDTRLRYPVLTLFDPGMLILIGIDPASITAEKTPVALWAYYETAEKTNKDGVAYKDIVSLEQINAPATATSVDTSAILGELRAIKALLLQLLHQQPDPPQPDPAKVARLRTLAHAGTGDPLACPHCGQDHRHFNPECPDHATRPTSTPPETETETEEPETSDPRAEFYRLGAQAMKDKTITHGDFNAIVNTANGEGYDGALATLRQKLA